MSALPKTSPPLGRDFQNSGTKLLTSVGQTQVSRQTASTPQHAEETSEVPRGMFPSGETAKKPDLPGPSQARVERRTKETGSPVADTQGHLTPTVKAGVEKRKPAVEGRKR